MKVIVSQPSLAHAVKTVARAMASSPTSPMLAGMLVVASGSDVTLEATDSITWRRHGIAANVEEEGATVLSGKVLASLVGTLPDSPVTIDAEGQSATIRCGRTRTRLVALDSADFPSFPDVEPDASVELPGQLLASMVEMTYRCTSKDNSRPHLAGVQVSVSDGTLRLVATDAYRLAVAEAQVGSDAEFEAVVPGTALRDAVNGASGDVTLSASERDVSVSFGGSTMVTRRVEGTFPGWRMLIPQSHSTTVTVDADELSDALGRASVIAAKDMRVTLTTSDDELTVHAQSPDQGETTESVPADVDGEQVTICLNHRFVAEGVNTMSGEATMELSGPMQPVVVRSHGDVEQLYLLMPVRV